MIKKCLLKGLCIFGLTLLPISFSSSVWESLVEFDIPDTKIINSSTILFLNNLNFSSTYNNITMNRVIYFPGVLSSNGRNRNFGIFSFYDGKPYLYTAYVYDGNVSSSYQGFATKVCVASAGSGLSYCGNNGNYTDFNCSRLNGEDVSVFLNAGGFTHGYIAKGQQGSSYAMNLYCFSNDINDYCFIGGAYSNVYCITTLSGSVSLINHNPDNVNRISWSSSPFSSNAKVPDVPTGKKVYTNQDIIDGFNAMGLTDEFCYGGFPISDIFENGQVPQEFVGYVWGSGAMILDIWDQYKSAYNNDPVSFIRSFYVAFENDNYNSFYGYPKALYGFFNQYFALNLQGRGFNSFMSDFTILDIWEYCNLEFKSDHNANYTGDTWKPKLAYNNSENINNQGRFNFSGNNALFSGNLSGFDDPKDFFSSLIGIFQGGLGDLGTTRTPLLPSYILVFLFAIIFIRMISH